jgi:peptidoglycan biosynthesis protein MviN/MurJ (putative lipid II flippase)
MKKQLSYTYALSVLSLVIGLANQLLVSNYFGTSRALDSYFLVLALINFLGFYSFPLRDASVPVFFTKICNPNSASQFASSVVSICIFVAIAELVVLMIGLELGLQDVLIGSATFNGIQVNLLLTMLPALLLVACGEILLGFMVSMNLVVEQGLCRLALSSSTCLSILLLPKILGIYVLVISFLIANSSLALLAIYFLKNSNVSLRICRPDFRVFGDVKKMFLTMVAVYIFAQFHILLERFVLTEFGDGVVSSFQYALAMVTILIGLASTPISSMLWPKFMKLKASGDKLSQIHILDSVFVYMTLPLLLICLFTFKNANQIVNFIFFHGNFNLDSVESTSTILRYLIFTLVPASYSQILVRLLNAQNESSAIGFVGIGMAIFGMGLLGYGLYFHNYKLVISQWFLANIVGTTVCFYFAYRSFTIEKLLTKKRIMLLIKAFVVMYLAYLFTPQVAIENSKIDLGINIVKDFLLFCGAFEIFIVLLNLDYFKNINLLRKIRFKY